MKTPITYYGGKQHLVKELLPLIPDHSLYVEAFAGGGALFFAKEPSKGEVINDLNGMVTNFYEIIKTRFSELKIKVDATLHSRTTYKTALDIYKNPSSFDHITKAWAFWVCTNQGFSGKIGSWALGRGNKIGKTLNSKREGFTADYADRLKYTQIESADALKIIKQYDSPETFFYLDPPYFNSDCGHYKGYSEADSLQLLELLCSIKGKFLLSSYPSDLLCGFIKAQNWYFLEKNKKINVSHLTKKIKTEMMVGNYDLKAVSEAKKLKNPKNKKIKKHKTEKKSAELTVLEEKNTKIKNSKILNGKKTPFYITNRQSKSLLEKNGEAFSYSEAKKIKNLLFQVMDL